MFALIGPVGTPTSAAAQPIATAAKVPFIGAFTGAGFLRNTKLENVINVRASYDAETEAWVKHLTEDLKISKIAIFYQDDAFGRAGLSGFKKAMEKRKMEIAAEATYERNTVAVKSGAAHAQARRAGSGRDRRRLQAGRRVHQAVAQDRLQPGVRQHLVRRRQRARQGARPRRQGRDRQPGRAVPGRRLAQGRRRLSRGDQGGGRKAEPEFVSLEGYLVGRLAIAALDKAGKDVTREGLLKAIKETGKFDIGGLPMTFSAEKNEGLDKVFMTIIQADGTFKPIEKMIKMSSN